MENYKNSTVETSNHFEGAHVLFLHSSELKASPAASHGVLREVMQVAHISKEQLYEENKAYNATEWRKTLDRFSNHQDCVFFKQINHSHSYDKYFAVYTIEEGITLWGDVAYSSGLYGNGFKEVLISSDLVVFTKLFTNGQQTGTLVNTGSNRKLMALQSAKWGAIFSNSL